MRFPISEQNVGRRTSLEEASGERGSGDEYAIEAALSHLRDLFGSSLRSVRIEAIKQSAAPATVYRLALDNEPAARRLPNTLIAKRIAPGRREDAAGQRREIAFYQDWAPRLGAAIPQVFYAGPDPGTDFGLIILEDVAATHRFHASDHVWRADELRRALRGYARLHVQGAELAESSPLPDWLFPRYEERVRERATELPDMIAALVRAGVCPPLRDVEQLIERTLDTSEALAGQPVTALHNDVAPQNIGLRQGDARLPDVCLVDWEMAGWGLPEMDLAYLFMQPFDNTRQVDRTQMLAAYWVERQRLEGSVPPPADRAAVQHHADAMLALWLIPVAYERCRRPFPPGSAPRVYWDSMFAVLGDKLQALTSL